MYYLRMEDLTANAFIELLHARSGDSAEAFLTYDTLEKYGSEVTKILAERNLKATFWLSGRETSSMLRTNSVFFEEKKTEDGLGVALHKDVSLNSLIEAFRGYLSWTVIEAFADARVVACLGITKSEGE